MVDFVSYFYICMLQYVNGSKVELVGWCAVHMMHANRQPSSQAARQTHEFTQYRATKHRGDHNYCEVCKPINR